MIGWNSIFLNCLVILVDFFRWIKNKILNCLIRLWLVFLDKEFNLDCIYIFIKNKIIKDLNFLFIKKLVIIRGILMLSKLIDWFLM